MRVRDLLEASSYHLAECRYRNLSPKTIELYKLYETAFCTWLRQTGAGLALHQLNAPNVRACTEWLKGRNAGTAKRGGQFAAHYFVGAMKTWSRFLVYEDVLEADFLVKLRRPKLVKVARKPLELHEVQAIRGAMYGNAYAARDVAMLGLMLDTGMRISEVVGLRLPDLDLQSGHVLVRGKGNRERLLPFGTGEGGGGKTGKLLRAWLRGRRAQPGETALFVSHRGKALTAEGWRAVFVRACQEAGVEDAQPHRLRHTFTTRYLVQHPGDVEGLRYRLGHMDDDQYREYTGLAGAIIARQTGGGSLVEAWFDEPPPRKPADRAPSNVTPLPTQRGHSSLEVGRTRRKLWPARREIRRVIREDDACRLVARR